MENSFDVLTALLEIIVLLLTATAESPVVGLVLILVVIITLLFGEDFSFPGDED